METSKKELLTYMHPYVGEGRATLAITSELNKNTQQEEIVVAVAFSSPRDQFARRKGRLIATGRLRSSTEKFKFRFPFNKEMRIKEEVIRQFADFVHTAENAGHLSGSVPNWAQNATVITEGQAILE